MTASERKGKVGETYFEPNPAKDCVYEENWTAQGPDHDWLTKSFSHKKTLMQGVPIVPYTPAIGSVTDQGNDDVVYDIVASGELPIIDISRSVRSVLFSTAVVKRFDRIVVKTNGVLFVLANLAIILSTTTPFQNIEIGRWISVPVLLISLPAPIIQIMYMRFDILRLLLRTYDFWFFTITWLISSISFMLCLADIRGLVTFGIWFGMQTNIMVDASISVRQSIWLSSLGLAISVMMITAIAGNGLQGMGDFVVFTMNEYVISGQTLVINGWSTLLFVLIRNVYRRRAAIRDHGKDNSTVVQCLSYRCRVRLRARGKLRRSANSLSSLSSIPSTVSSMTRPTASYFQNAKMVQMRCMRVKFKIRARDLVARFAVQLLECPDTARLIIFVRAFLTLLIQVGVISTWVSFIPGVPNWCRYTALATTSLFCLITLAMQHRQLLKYVVFSFDFAFLSFQLTVMHLALCDLYTWDTRAFPIMSVWLWFHWVLTFDCIPPALKSRMKYQYRFVALIAAQFLVAHLGLVYQLVALDRQTFTDRAILHMQIRGSTIEVRVLPLLVSRMPMTFFWSCRIVLRLLRRSENELVIMQGTVTYINNRRKVKKKEAEFMAARVLSKARLVQVTRNITRRMSAFGVAIMPSPSSLPVRGEHSPPQGTLNPQHNARLLNVAGQVYDASRVITHLKQHQVADANDHDDAIIGSGPMRFHDVGNPERESSAESVGSMTRIIAPDASTRISGHRQKIHNTEPAASVCEHGSESESTQKPRFVI